MPFGVLPATGAVVIEEELTPSPRRPDAKTDPSASILVDTMGMGGPVYPSRDLTPPPPRPDAQRFTSAEIATSVLKTFEEDIRRHPKTFEDTHI